MKKLEEILAHSPGKNQEVKEQSLMKINDPIRVSYAHSLFGDEERNAVMEVLKTPQIVAGKYAAEFENKIAALFGKK